MFKFIKIMKKSYKIVINYILLLFKYIYSYKYSYTVFVFYLFLFYLISKLLLFLFFLCYTTSCFSCMLIYTCSSLSLYLSLDLFLLFVFFVLGIYLDHFITFYYYNHPFKKFYLSFRKRSYPFVKVILFIFFLFIFSIFNLWWSKFYLFDFDFLDMTFNLVDDNVTGSNSGSAESVNANIGTNSTINVNNPKTSVSISDRGINNIAAAVSSAGGATVGLKVAKHVGGAPASKLAVGLGTMAVIQLGTGIMSKVLNNNQKGGKNVNNFISYFSIFNKDNITDINNILNDYPLNLLVDINNGFYAALLFLSVIFNIYLGRYLLNKNYSNYISNNYFGNILKKILDRYINIWTKTSKNLLIYCYCMLLFSIILCKVAFFIILNYYHNNFTDTFGILNDYPLNLIFDINFMLYAALMFLFIIFNIYLCEYLYTRNKVLNHFYWFIRKCEKKGVSNIYDRILLVLLVLLYSYVWVWGYNNNNDNKIFLIVSYCMLWLCIVLCKMWLSLIM